LFRRHHLAGQKYLARRETTHGQGNALTILAHQLARVVYYMLKRQTAGDLDKFLQGLGSRVGEPDAELATQGISLSQACSGSCWTASLNAKVRIGLLSQSPGLGWDTRSGSCRRGDSRGRGRGLPLSRA
jgi:hypothetical protein